MKITASRRDDILRRQSEYEAAEARNKAKEKDASRRFRSAQNDVFSGVEEEIRRQLGDKIGELTIRIEERYGSGISVEIGNDTGSPRRSPNASLTWRWSARLDREGNVVKESSSWSGLEATTLEQVADLKLCVEQLEIINTMDWAKLLDVTLPDWRDYQVTDLEDIGPRPNFKQELIEADIEDIIGRNALVKCGEGRNYRGAVYYQILRDSGSQYAVKEIAAAYVDAIQQGKPMTAYGRDPITTIAELMDYSGQTMRIRKSTFMANVIQPLDIIEF